MTEPHIDTDVIIRLLTGDDPRKQSAAAALFERIEAEDIAVAAPDTVIADAVFVLSSKRLYRLSRVEIREMLTSLLHYSNFKVTAKRIVIDALELYSETNLDFGDAMIAASMRSAGSASLYSYDRDFDKLPGVLRVEP